MFFHPSPRSTVCAHCQQAPLSHHMEHFETVSKKVASQKEAQTNQCRVCQQTTSWNDIRGVDLNNHH
jgi:hypothetical protein